MEACSIDYNYIIFFIYFNIIKNIILKNKHTSVSKYSFDKSNLNNFRTSDKINPIRQNTSKLLYLKF